MTQQSLGEFEELVLLMVAALHDEAYGVAILEGLEEKLKKKVNISAQRYRLPCLKKVFTETFLTSSVFLSTRMSINSVEFQILN